MKFTYESFLAFLSERYGETPERLEELNQFGELGLDSLSLFALLGDIEEKYQITIDIEDLTEVDSVKKMYRYISEQVQ